MPDYDPAGVPMLRITDIEGGRASRDELTTISPTLSQQYTRTIVETGDIVLSVVGTIGKALEVDATLSGVNLSRALARLRVAGEIKASFLHYLLGSAAFQHYVDLICVGTAQRVLNMGDLSSWRIGVPPLEEQQQICEQLEGALAELSELEKEAERAIGLLAERRSVLISAAITGQIDVRHRAAAEAA